MVTEVLQKVDPDFYQDPEFRRARINLQGDIARAASGRKFADGEDLDIARSIVYHALMYYTRLDVLQKEKWVDQNGKTPYKSLDEMKIEEFQKCAGGILSGNYSAVKKYLKIEGGDLVGIRDGEKGFGEETFVSQLARKAKWKRAELRPFIDFSYGLMKFAEALAGRGPDFSDLNIDNDNSLLKKLARTLNTKTYDKPRT